VCPLAPLHSVSFSSSVTISWKDDAAKETGEAFQSLITTMTQTRTKEHQLRMALHTANSNSAPPFDPENLAMSRALENFEKAHAVIPRRDILAATNIHRQAPQSDSRMSPGAIACHHSISHAATPPRLLCRFPCLTDTPWHFPSTRMCVGMHSNSCTR
jgi:hypothetical protein